MEGETTTWLVLALYLIKQQTGKGYSLWLELIQGNCSLAETGAGRVGKCK